MNKLSVPEWSKLRQHEHVIETGQQTFVEVGVALAAIRDEKLYREKYATFNDYCEKKWGWTRQHAYRLMEQAGVVESLPAKCRPRVTSGRAASALADVPEADREAIVSSIEGPVTTAKVKAATKPTEHEVDETGTVIPEGILADWNRALVAGKDFAWNLSEIKCAIEDALKNKDEIYAEVNNQVVADLVNAYNAVKLIIPHAVCPTCQGRQRAACRTCGGRGFISKFYFETKIDSKTRALREKSKKK